MIAIAAENKQKKKKKKRLYDGGDFELSIRVLAGSDRTNYQKKESK